uniref:Brk1 n=1 Tax=Arundo donax TaxID=35708 RepID=A0A0A9DWM6_ARUDO
MHAYLLLYSSSPLLERKEKGSTILIFNLAKLCALLQKLRRRAN